MGTRGFIGWKLDGEIVIAYQQFDSYPDYVGVRFLGAVRTEQQRILTEYADAQAESGQPATQDKAELAKIVRERFAARLRSVRRVSEDGPEPTDEDREKYAHLANGQVNNGEGWYSLLRNLQGELSAVLDAQVILEHDPNWPRESLFCEWGYLLNLDADGGLGRIEVYRGFQTASPKAGEWAGEPAPLEKTFEWVGAWPYQKRVATGTRPSEYFPVDCLGWFSFIDPPTEDEFLARVTAVAEEQEAARS